MRNNQSPSIYSIFNNALPYYLDRVDISTLTDEGSSFAANFLHQLLKGEVLLQFDASSVSVDKISHIYFESKNLSKTMGGKTLGFGFPFLIDTHEGELLVAPLFIWQISIEPAQTKVDAWVIKYDTGNFVQPNYQVVRYLKEKYDFDYQKKLEDAIENNSISTSNLEGVCQDLADRFHLKTFIGEGGIIEVPGIDEIGGFTEEGVLHRSGVIGIFPPQHTKLSEATSKPENVFISSDDMPDSDPFVFPFLAADPEQVTALENLVKKKVSVVEGIDNLGKGQTLLNLLFVALMQGKKCLVVSERAPALKKNQNILAKSGLHQLNFLLTDALNDRDQILELLRLAAKGVGKNIPLDKQDFLFKKNKFVRAKKALDDTYHSTNKKVFGNHNWTDTVGLFLQSNRKEGKELLASHLQRQDFTFMIEEHQALKKGVENCYPLFQKIKTLKHPLSNLNDRVFQQVSPEGGRAYVIEQLNIFLGKARQLHHRYIADVERYRNKLEGHYDSYISEINNNYKSVHGKILEYKDQLGDGFIDAGTSAFRIPFFYSKKKKKIIAAQNDVSKSYRLLKKTFEEKPYFEFTFSSAKDGMLIKEVVQNIESFNSAFDYWKNKLESIIQEDIIRLNSKTAHPSLGVKEEITELEYALDLMLEELNEAKIYQKHLENKTLTLPQRQKFLESIIEQMEQTQLNLRDFPVFYQWQSKWLELTPVGRKVVASLVKVKPADWTAAFESWYFHNLLTECQNNFLPYENEDVKNYDESWHALKPLILDFINAQWQEKQIEGLKRLKRKNKSIYRQIFEKSIFKKQSPMSLAEIFEDSMDTVTDLLPVLFVTPQVALNIFPNGYKFDLVIFEEANRFSIERSTEIADLGHQLMIFGSDDSNGNETSLLQYALENEVSGVKITNKYEAPVSNMSFSDVPKPSPFHAQKCVVENLEGRFHEMEGINDFEAQHILRLLNQIKQTPQRVFPSVGIVAFTVEQRNLISSYILKLKQQNVVGSEKIRQLERNGMGVYFVEELFGQHFDVLIVSCTFGAVNIKGKLTKKISLLNTPEGISFLHLLINKPLRQLILLHSFSEEHLAAFKGKQWDKGTWLLAHFIAMSEAVQQENEVKYLEEKETIGKKEPRAIKNPNLIKEIVLSLSSYIDDSRCKLHVPWEDVLLPLVVSPIKADGKNVVVIPDGFFADTQFTSGVWEEAHIKKLQKENYELILTWSLNWMKDPAAESRKLASQIIKLDGQSVYAKNKKEASESKTIHIDGLRENDSLE